MSPYNIRPKKAVTGVRLSERDLGWRAGPERREHRQQVIFCSMQTRAHGGINSEQCQNFICKWRFCKKLEMFIDSAIQHCLDCRLECRDLLRITYTPPSLSAAHSFLLVGRLWACGYNQDPEAGPVSPLSCVRPDTQALHFSDTRESGDGSWAHLTATRIWPEDTIWHLEGRKIIGKCELEA